MTQSDTSSDISLSFESDRDSVHSEFALPVSRKHKAEEEDFELAGAPSDTAEAQAFEDQLIRGIMGEGEIEEEEEEEEEEDVKGKGKGKRKRGEKRPPKPKKDPFEFHPELHCALQDLTTVEPSQALQPPELKLKLLPFQLEGLKWLSAQEYGEFKGGILADEMGMGKTIQIISLLLTNRVAPTLIVCPTVALMQWQAEILNHTLENTFNVTVFYGQNKKLGNDGEIDIVLTTYAVVETAWRRQQSGFKRRGDLVKEKSLLHQIPWKRVVLDEAHMIKDRSNNTARSVFNLTTDYKWSLTGTPLHNRVGELYSLIRFMRIDPYSFYFCKKCPCKSDTWRFTNRRTCDDCGHAGMSHFCWWNHEIMKPIQKFGYQGLGLIGMTKLGKLLDITMLRRTKLEREDDLGLPPRIVHIRRDNFNEEEVEFYEALYSESKKSFSKYVKSGTVLNNYAHIFELLSRLRQAADHPYLVVHHQNQIQNSDTSGVYICGICHEVAEDPIASKCRHTFCRVCITEYAESFLSGTTAPQCPTCFLNMTIDLTQISLPPKENAVAPTIINRIASHQASSFPSSTKIEALLEELTNLRAADWTIKSLVFSQYTNFLDLLKWRLQRAGFGCVALDGRMSPLQRAATIKEFSTNSKITVFLISLKAGGVALNLVEASRIFIMDPWWSPAPENQAMDRIHRLGQHRPIQITRMIIENSIESRIVQLQEKKTLLFQSTVGKDATALDRLSLDDLAFLFN